MGQVQVYMLCLAYVYMKEEGMFSECHVEGCPPHGIIAVVSQ